MERSGDPGQAPGRLRGQGAILCCALLWSTSGLFIKLVSWHPLLIAGSRSLVAAIFLWTVRAVVPRREKTRNQRGPFIAGGIAYALTMISFVWANKLTSPANAILLQYGAPVWAAILGWVLIREKPRPGHWLALILVAGGLCIFFRESIGGGAFWGDCAAVLSGIFFGAHSVLLRMQKEGNPADSMLLAHGICAAAALPVFFFYPPSPSGGALGALAFMGIFQVGLSSLLFSYGIRRVSAAGAMLTAAIEPVLSPVWVLLVTGERPSRSAILGGGIIVAAVLVSSILPASRPGVKGKEGAA